MGGFGYNTGKLPTRRDGNTLRASYTYLYWRLRFIVKEQSLVEVGSSRTPQQIRGIALYDEAGTDITGLAEVSYLTNRTSPYGGTEILSVYYQQDLILWHGFPYPVAVRSYDIDTQYVRANVALEFSQDNRIWARAHKAYAQPIIDAGDHSNRIVHTYTVF